MFSNQGITLAELKALPIQEKIDMLNALDMRSQDLLDVHVTSSQNRNEPNRFSKRKIRKASKLISPILNIEHRKNIFFKYIKT